MKAEIFAIVFFAFCIGTYLVYTKHAQGGEPTSSMTVNDNKGNYENLRYRGRIELNEDDSQIKSISPGGFFEFEKNGRKLSIQSDSKGRLSQIDSEGENKSSSGQTANLFLKEAVTELLAYGYDANDRIEKIARSGGDSALLSQVDGLKLDNLKVMYINRVLQNDSLPLSIWPLVINKIGALDADNDKEKLLFKVPVALLNQGAIAEPYFRVLGLISAADSRENLYVHIISHAPVQDLVASKVLDGVENLDGDFSKQKILERMIATDSLATRFLERFTAIIGRMNDDQEKGKLLANLAERNELTEAQKISILRQTSTISSDEDRANLLLRMAPRLGKSDSLKAAYLQAAKIITDEAQYGRTVRAVE